jgi:hypothetical protein
LQNKNPRFYFSDFYLCNQFLVDHARGNCIFAALFVLSERLDEDGIEALIEGEDKMLDG